MLTRGVYFANRPNRVEVHRIGEQGYTCRVDFPVNIQEIENDDGDVQYRADVYSLECGYTEGIAARINQNYEDWLAVAKEIIVPQPTVQDAIDAINALTEIVLGGE